jgi:very-short-patch-repair endonuclease
MWVKFTGTIKRIIDYIEFLLGIKPNIPSDIETKPVKKEAQSISTPPEKPLALPTTSKYELIDWENDPPKYRKRKGILTFPERKFFWLLRRFIDQNHQILSMVRMADVIYLSNETADYKYHKNNILCKHFDYVICDKNTFEPLLVIELDDPKHQYVFRKRIDEFKDKACEEAGIPILRFQVRQNYNEGKLEQQIRQMLANPD